MQPFAHLCWFRPNNAALVHEDYKRRKCNDVSGPVKEMGLEEVS